MGRMTVVRMCRVMVAAAMFVALGAGCETLKLPEEERLRKGCEALGICDPEPPLPEDIDILCDVSRGSTCTRQTLAEALEEVLDHVAERGGSRVRLWTMGRTVATSVLVGAVEVPVVTVRSKGARASAFKVWKSASLDLLLSQAAPALSGTAPTTSPLAASFAKISLASATGRCRYLVAVSDAREMGAFSFECRPLPKDEAWLDGLQTRGLLRPTSFDGVNVIFAFSSLPPIGNCPVDLAREIRIRELWTLAFTKAGAQSVRFLNGAPTF